MTPSISPIPAPARGLIRLGRRVGLDRRVGLGRLAGLGRLVGFACLCAPVVTAPAHAQEALFLRIRPAGDTPAGLGSAGPSDAAIAQAARARSEAVWARAERRSRIAIASVCTGCIPTARPAEPAAKPVGSTGPEADAVPTAPEATPIAAGSASAPDEASAVSHSPLAQADVP